MEIYETLYIGDVVRMRKQHPCGGYEWEIVRVGADIGIVCQTCGRRVLLSRRKFARQAKEFLQRGTPTDEGTDSARESQEIGDQNRGSSGA
jgi:hypothetical protein